MTGLVEIEAKFVVPSAEVASRLAEVGELAGLALGSASRHRLLDTYYDTQDRALWSAGYVCRLRVEGGRRLVSVKSLTPAEEGIHRRAELEVELGAGRSRAGRRRSGPSSTAAEEAGTPEARSEPALDSLASWPASEARELVQRVAGDRALVPLFVLAQERTIRMVGPEDAPLIELALDRVELSADGSAESWLVAEAELRPTGTEEDLALVARTLREEWGLVPDQRSKFERATEILDLRVAAPAGAVALAAPPVRADRLLFDVLQRMPSRAGAAPPSATPPSSSGPPSRAKKPGSAKAPRPAPSLSSAPAPPGGAPEPAPEPEPAAEPVRVAVPAPAALDAPTAPEPAAPSDAEARSEAEAPPEPAAPSDAEAASEAEAAVPEPASVREVRPPAEREAVPAGAPPTAPPRTQAARGEKPAKAGRREKRERPVHWDREALYEAAAGKLPDRPGLRPTDTMAEAARKTLLFHYLNMLRHEEGTRLGEDIEELHDMRVSTRRMRAAFRVFEDHLDPTLTKPFLRGLRSTGRTLGAVRDLDVFREKTQHYLDTLPEERRADLDPLLAVWREERERDRAAMIRYLDSDEYERFVVRFGVSLHHSEEWPEAPSRGGVRPSLLRDVVPPVLYERVAEVRAFDAVLRQPDAPLDRYHELRIYAKGLRYTLEYFREVLGPESKSLIDDIKVLQDHLGDLQDAVVSSGVLRTFLAFGTWSWPKKAPAPALLDVCTVLPVTQYLLYRQEEADRLVRTFPEVWERIQSAEFSRRVAAAVAGL